MKPDISHSRSLLTLVFVLLLNGCALFGISSEPETYRVERGDTLYSIAWQNDLDFRELAAWNGIRPPYVIHPGQVLQLEPPDDFVYFPEQQAPPRPPPEPGISTTPLPGDESPDIRPSESAPAAGGDITVASAHPPTSVRWRWPVEGELLPMLDNSRPGINIAGSLGEPVRAAAGGRVVYSGSGLRGYGQLVIVKHDDNYLSAYGYNRRLLVRQGDEVHVGQPIAEMGEGPQRRAVLHFEIRQSGKALDPIQLLPAR